MVRTWDCSTTVTSTILSMYAGETCFSRQSTFRSVVSRTNGVPNRTSERAFGIDTNIICIFLGKDGDSSITVVPTLERAFDLDTDKICLFLSKDRELRTKCRKVQCRYFSSRCFGKRYTSFL